MRFTNLLSFFSLLLILSSCSSKIEKIPYNSAFNAYLAGFTNGEISSHSNMVIHFANDIDSAKQAAVTPEHFKTDPSFEGDLIEALNGEQFEGKSLRIERATSMR